MPVRYNQKLFNCATVFCRGTLLGLVPKIHLPNYTEFYEGRWFTSGRELLGTDFCIPFAGQESVEFSAGLLFRCVNEPLLTIGVEICEDLWVADPPSTRLAQGGATLVLNPSASDETVCKDAYRRTPAGSHLRAAGLRLCLRRCGMGESSTDLIYAGHSLIAENGMILAERRFADRPDHHRDRPAKAGPRAAAHDDLPGGRPRPVSKLLLNWSARRPCSPAPSPPIPSFPPTTGTGRPGAGRS
ncbi:MAG: hypothetical protein ACLUNZ_05010 [Evtepia sp.]